MRKCLCGALSVVIMAGGCGPTPGVATTRRSIRVITDPPGAHIEMDGAYMGRAPVTITTNADAWGCFIRHSTIRALPSEPGQFTQSKNFAGGYQYAGHLNDHVPEQVFFDMRLGPVPSQYDVTLRPE